MTLGKILLLFLLVAISTASIAQETSGAKEWLTNTVKAYFDNDSNMHFKLITTKRYAEFKQDALNIDYDVPNSLTKEQFERKWSNIYDISYPEISESFLIGQQDYGVIELSKCDLLSSKDNKQFVFDTIIYDTSFNNTYSIKITVVRTEDGFKIDDVKRKK